jgi:uncharacterized protein
MSFIYAPLSKHLGRFNALLLSALTIVALSLIGADAARGQQPAVKSLKEIRERGIVMQEWENSCAAASVATVLTYGFRDPVTERYAAEKMLEKTDPLKVRTRGGFSLLDLRMFVQGRGYQGDAYQGLSIDDLKIFHAPIVPISTMGYNHYVVFNGMAGELVLLADPAFGHRRMSQNEFLRAWIDGMAFVVTRPPSPSRSEFSLTLTPVSETSDRQTIRQPRSLSTNSSNAPTLEIPWPWGLPLFY